MSSSETNSNSDRPNLRQDDVQPNSSRNNIGLQDDYVSDEEDLFGEDLMLDYEQVPELDHYEEEHLDDESVSSMSVGTRMAAEATLAERDRLEMFRRMNRRGLDLFNSDMSESGSGSQTSSTIMRRRRRLAENSLRGQTDQEVETETVDNLEDTRGMTSKEWVSQRATRNEIRNRFKFLLKTFVDANGRSHFKEKLRTMTQYNHSSFEVEYTILAREQSAIALFLVEVPNEVLAILNRGSKEIVHAMYPNYEKIASEITVKIKDLPLIEEIRSLRQVHLNQMIRTHGIVNTSTNIIPQLGIVKFDCLKCSYVLGPFVQTQEHEIKPGTCPSCQSLGPFNINMMETLYNNYQRLTIQESPGKISAGRVPRSKDVILLGDLCDSCRPGDEIDLTGIYSNSYDGALNVATGFPVFSTVIMANNVQTEHDSTTIRQNLTNEDIRQIISLSKDPSVVERITASMCPSIYGHENIKRAIAMALFGGCSKNPSQKHRIRGDINVLLCGDPGTAKSQFLKYISRIAPRAVYTTGQGASAVGLTAYVHKSPVTREWTLQAGALVLADNGVCLIDEFDKMSDQDRTSIHEAMEQQTISISKAGIVATLQARCAVIAASNPVGGRYNGRLTFSQNVDLTEPIISRFDIICIVRDETNEFEDTRLAQFILRSHIRSHHAVTAEEIAALEDLEERDKYEEYKLIDQDLLRKYILYARDHCKPKISKHQEEHIAKVYADMRRESAETNSVPITARHIESIIRCAESYAKMHLRSYVSTDDVKVAIKVIVESFVSTQRGLVRRNMEQIFSAHLTYNRSTSELLLSILKNMVLEEQAVLKIKFGQDTALDVVEIDETDYRQRCRRLDGSDPSFFYRQPIFWNNHFTYDAENRIIRYTRVAN